MGQLLAAEALLSGLRLVRRAPLAVAIWWLMRVSQQLSYQAINPFVAHGPQSRVFAGLLVTLAFETVLLSAVLRAQLRPGRPALAWLRFGWVEAKMFALIAAAGLIAVLTAASVSIVVSSLASYAGDLPEWLWDGARAAGSAAAILALLSLCPLPAILVDTGQVDFRAAWSTMRGHYFGLVTFVLVMGLVGWALGVVWDQAMRLPALSGDADAGKVVHISVWPSPLLALQTAGHELLNLALLIFDSAAVVAVWRASRQTVD